MKDEKGYQTAYDRHWDRLRGLLGIEEATRLRLAGYKELFDFNEETTDGNQ